jgi:carboxyl-terminal processing protease
MNYKLLFFLTINYLFNGISFGQENSSHCHKVEQILNYINQNHIDPHKLDPEFNEVVNQSFVRALDPVGLYLASSDAKKVKSYCLDLSDIDCNLNKDFMNLIIDFYKNKLLSADSMITAFPDQDLDFTTNDTLVFTEPDKLVYKLNQQALTAFWIKYLRFQLLRYYLSAYRTGDSTFVKNEENLTQNKGELMSYIRKKEKCRISHLLEYPGGFDKYVFNLYLNSITSSFDPHTAYFSYNEKEQFESSLSTSKFSFGAELDENENGEIFISRMIPGGSAWRSKELKEGDVLLKIRFPRKEPIDLMCSNLYEIEGLLYNSGSDKIEVTARSPHGLVKTAELKMEILESSENVVYSFVFESDKKIGYISLPGFYTKPDETNPLGCASDLVKEILKLKEDHVDGIILDVRNNGGGSIIEAVDLAGVFINSGPLGIYKTNNEDPTIIKDLNRGTIYDGPLVLLVNGFSASASEMLAGILQDYNRAVVVGTKTFGKASGQIILPLVKQGSNHYAFNANNSPDHDYLKLTTVKYYQLNGSSYQAIGIKPDITFPSHSSYSIMNEAEFPSALKNDSIEKEVDFEPLAPLPLDTLCIRSNSRIKDNKNFTEYTALNDSIKPLFSGNIYIPLNFSFFQEHYSKTIGFFSRMDSLAARPNEYFSIRNNSFDEKILNYDEYKRSIHSDFIESLQKDYFIEESYFIANDLIRTLENKK